MHELALSEIFWTKFCIFVRVLSLSRDITFSILQILCGLCHETGHSPRSNTAGQCSHSAHLQGRTGSALVWSQNCDPSNLLGHSFLGSGLESPSTHLKALWCSTRHSNTQPSTVYLFHYCCLVGIVGWSKNSVGNELVTSSDDSVLYQLDRLVGLDSEFGLQVTAAWCIHAKPAHNLCVDSSGTLGAHPSPDCLQVLSATPVDYSLYVLGHSWPLPRP